MSSEKPNEKNCLFLLIPYEKAYRKVILLSVCVIKTYSPVWSLMLHNVLNSQASREMINLEELHYYPKYWPLYSDLKFNNHIKHHTESIVVFSASPKQMTEHAESIVAMCGMAVSWDMHQWGWHPVYNQLWGVTILCIFRGLASVQLQKTHKQDIVPWYPQLNNESDSNWTIYLAFAILFLSLHQKKKRFVGAFSKYHL